MTRLYFRFCWLVSCSLMFTVGFVAVRSLHWYSIAGVTSVFAGSQFRRRQVIWFAFGSGYMAQRCRDAWVQVKNIHFRQSHFEGWYWQWKRTPSSARTSFLPFVVSWFLANFCSSWARSEPWRRSNALKSCHGSQDKPVIGEESFEEVQVREGWAKARNEKRLFGTMLNEFWTQLADNYLNYSITIMNHCYYFHY